MNGVLKSLAIMALAAASAGLGAASAAEIAGVRVGEPQPGISRLVVETDAAPAYAIVRAAGAEPQIVVKLNGARFAAGAPKTGGSGVIASVDSRAEAGGARIFLRLADPAALKDAFIIPPSAQNPRHRLVVDLKKADMAAFRAAFAEDAPFGSIVDVIVSAAAAPPESETLRPPPPAPTQKAVRDKPVIVIDAGHGGGDPGASGPAGAKESAVTLAAAKTLAETLDKTGRYTVVLTRGSDIRLAHEERSQRARDARADLFISLHADAHSNPAVRGASVYTLSDDGVERSAREARANGDYIVGDIDISAKDPQVGGILYNLAQRKTGDESDRFAETLIGGLAGVTPILNNTHRRGNFKVLLAPDVPAVLLELAFISNARDEQNLNSPAWRRRTMSAVAASIDRYFAGKTAGTARAPAGAPSLVGAGAVVGASGAPK